MQVFRKPLPEVLKEHIMDPIGARYVGMAWLQQCMDGD